MDTPLLTTSQVARQLNLSAERVRQLARQGVLRPTERTALGRLWDPTEVRRFADQRRGGPLHPPPSETATCEDLPDGTA